MRRYAFLIALLTSMLFHLIFMGKGIAIWPQPYTMPSSPKTTLTTTLRAMKLDDRRLPAPRTHQQGPVSLALSTPQSVIAQTDRQQKSLTKTQKYARPQKRTTAAPSLSSPLEKTTASSTLAAPGHPTVTSEPDVTPHALSSSNSTAATPASPSTIADISIAASAPPANIPPDTTHVPTESIASAPATSSFPHQVHIDYQVFYGIWMAGRARLTWQRNGSSYQLESLVFPIMGPQLRYVSEGKINDTGLQPTSFTAWRATTQREQAYFDWETKELRYGDPATHHVPLREGAQDIFSIIYQLALKGAPDPDQRLQITTGKKVYDYPFSIHGETLIDTEHAPLRAIIIRAESDDTSTEFWLAPDLANQPTRIVHSDKGSHLEMRAVRIELDNTIAWQLPTPSTRKRSQ